LTVGEPFALFRGVGKSGEDTFRRNGKFAFKNDCCVRRAIEFHVLSLAYFFRQSLCRRPVIVNDVAVRERTGFQQLQWQALFERLEWRLAFSERDGAD